MSFYETHHDRTEECDFLANYLHALVIWKKYYWCRDNKLKRFSAIGISSILCFIFLFIGPANHLYYEIIELHKDWIDCPMNISIILTFCMCCFTYICLIIEERNILAVARMADLNKFVAVRSAPCLQKFHLQNKALVYLISGQTIFILLWCGYVDLIGACGEDPAEDEEYSSCNFIIPIYFNIGALTTPPYKHIINLLICVAILYYLYVVVISIVIIIVLVRYINYCFDELVANIKNIKIINCQMHRRRALFDCVEHHVYLIRLWDLAANSFKNPLFALFIITTLGLSTNIINIMTKIDFLSLGHAVFYVLANVVFGLLGEKLKQNCDILENACFYGIPWDEDRELAKDMAFIALRARMPMKLPAGIFTIYNNALLLKIFNTCYSYIMLLKDIQH